LASATKRDERDPYVMFNYDRMINYGAIAIPGAALMTTLFLGADMYTAEGLQAINPRDRETGTLRFDRWTELGVAKAYCWTHLGVGGENGAYLWHYAFFPYILMLLGLLIHLVQITWRFSDLDRLTSLLDFVLDGLEESIRDILDFLLEEDDEKTFKAKRPMSRANSTERLIATQIDMDEIRADLRETLDAKVVKAAERSLWEQLIEYHREKKMVEKYRTFRVLLEHFSKSTTVRHGYMMRRMLLIMLNLISVYTLYTLFIDPTRNPTRIECMLPPELHYENVTTMIVYYTAANMRFSIVALTCVLQMTLIIFAIITWTVNHYKQSKGLALLLNLPMVNECELKMNANSDLKLIMDLVITNKNRFKFIRLAIDVLDTTSFEVASRSKRNNGFLLSLAEMARWNVSDDTKLNDVVDKINGNVN